MKQRPEMMRTDYESACPDSCRTDPMTCGFSRCTKAHPRPKDDRGQWCHPSARVLFFFRARDSSVWVVHYHCPQCGLVFEGEMRK